MTLIASLLFIAVIACSFFTITSSLQSAMPRIVEIIEDRETAYTASPKIRMGEIKHYKASARIASVPTNISNVPLHLSYKVSDKNNQLDLAA